ncbi:endonuclease [Mycoplasmopsis ciconiae]|uniref:Endonuclease n=1 Tax=Mycoplasmopsis ciconiae TaxID=561067 RepID=A0ABU7MLR9_9BACT|nr:endonuclease [Mycoplasmopsis ciconiae]
MKKITKILTSLAIFATLSAAYLSVSCQKQESENYNNSKYVYDSSNNYYADADGLSGKQLFDKLSEIQQRHLDQINSYNDLKNLYINTNAFRDDIYEKDNSLLDIYSENPDGVDPYVYKNYQGGNGVNEGSGTNREHLIPQSWFNRKEPMRNDAHHVWPTDILVNRQRGNLPHDDVIHLESETKNKSKLGKNKNQEDVFEPVNAFKGDIARAYLYFALTYNNQDIYQNKNNVFKNKFPYIKKDYLQTYLKWNNNDSLDYFDVKRNNEIYKNHSIGLRNPFSDYPDLAENLFGENPKPFIDKGVLVEIK